MINRTLAFLLVLFTVFSVRPVHSQINFFDGSRKAKKKRIAEQRTQIVSTAKKFIGVPYVWGGSGPSGFDCSGFTSYVYQKANVEIPRLSRDQRKQLRKKKSKKRLKPGDLVFFGRFKTKHVGIVTVSTKEELVMIHASNGGVCETNIYESKYWKRRLKRSGTYL